MRKSDKQVAFRLTPVAKRMLNELASRLGVTNTAVVEMAIRKFAKMEGIEMLTAGQVELNQINSEIFSGVYEGADQRSGLWTEELNDRIDAVMKSRGFEVVKSGYEGFCKEPYSTLWQRKADGFSAMAFYANRGMPWDTIGVDDQIDFLDDEKQPE
jgi:predicted DNA-binding protein